MYVVMRYDYDETEVIGVWPTAAEAASHARSRGDIAAGGNGAVAIERWEGDNDLGAVTTWFAGDGVFSFRASSRPDDLALKDELDAALAQEAR